jgi:hypothetical protein
MIKSFVKPCITQDSLKDMETQMCDPFKSASSDYDLQVSKSTSQEFNGVLTCAVGATKSISSKRLES